MSVNPDKTGLVVFTRKRRAPGFFEPHFLGLLYVGLGIVLDSRLTWREHVDVKVRKVHNLLWACRRVYDVTWGQQAGKRLSFEEFVGPELSLVVSRQNIRRKIKC